MNKTQSTLSQWFDPLFFKTGAFLTSPDGETITFGKGGRVTTVKTIGASNEPVFYLKDFYQDIFLAYSPDTYLECTRDEIQEFLQTLPDRPLTAKPLHNDEDIYVKDFEKLKKSLDAHLKKVVLITRETYDGFRGEATVQRLFKKAFEFGTGIPYGFWDETNGVIGSTPELLYNIDFDQLQTYALAGTAKTGEEQKLLSSVKDRHEHDLVVLDIKEKLETYCEDIQISETTIHPFKNLIHLKTNIEASIDEDVDLTKLTTLLSPTAALGGYPKNLSLAFLKDSLYSKKYPKRFFGSCFGLISEEVKQFVVSIRNVQWDQKHLFIESGGGIVSDSELTKELEEIQLKRLAITKHYL